MTTCIKKSYATQAEAKQRAETLATLYSLDPQTDYLCPDCKLFHLTSNNDPNKKLPKLCKTEKAFTESTDRQAISNDWHEKNRKKTRPERTIKKDRRYRNHF